MQTIGQRLRAAREEKTLTLDKVFQATRIRVNYLQALEDDDLSVMPSPVQARGYLRNYAEFLGLDLDGILEEVRNSQENTGQIIGPADTFPQPLIEPSAAASAAEEGAPHALPMAETAKEAEPRPEPTFVEPKRRTRKKDQPVEESAQPPEPKVEPPAELPTEAVPQPDVAEGHWQTWLNRVSTMISVRKNKTAEAEDTDPIERIGTSGLQPSSEQEPSQPDTLQPGNDLSSDEIFREIGAELHERRRALSLHLEEVERNTKVKSHYLEALELGAMDRLPSTVQTRGMLSNYASFLDMDVDAVLLRFADALQARHRERNPQKPVRKPGQPILANMPALRNFIAGDMIFGVGMAVLLVGFVIWGINRVLTIQSQEQVQPTAPSISDVLLATPDPSLFTATATLLPVESFAEEATPTIIIPTININVQVQVNLIAVERTYMRVVVDGEVAFEGRVIPGNAYLFEAEDQVEVLVGSGGAVRIAYNGRDLGLMGTFGQIVNNIYRADEIITPTPLATATPTNTLPPSPTLRPTNSPPPTNTPIP